MSANIKSRKGVAFQKIHISEKTTGEDHLIRPLTRKEVLIRLDWYGAMIPLYNHDSRWFKFAVKRMDELNVRLRETHNGGN